MSRVYHLLAIASLALLLGVLVRTPGSRAADVGFVEDFALAKDRAAALKQLIPGSEEYYYYHALHYLNSGQFEKIDALAGPWHQAFGQSARLTEIQNRRALLTFDKTPAQTLAYLRTHLGLYYNHEKEFLGAIPNLPSTLDANLISRTTLRASSLARWGNLDNFETIALDGMAAEKLSWQQRRQLLSRLDRPDIAGLSKLIADDLASENSGAFGSFKIHGLLTKTQLEDLLKLQPSLLNQSFYVNAYISKLHPGADDDWKRDKALAQAYLERLQAFVDTLSAVHNALKAHVLYHRLALDRSKGEYNKERFLAYLKLPRQQHYMSKAMNENHQLNIHPANLQVDYFAVTLLPIVGSDEPLVRSYLAQFFLEAKDFAEFEPFVNDVYLRHLLAETKLVNGIGDAEAWAKLLPPEQLRQLKDRVDLDFAFTNPTDFAVGGQIRLELFVKNAGNVLVKIYEVNTKHFYRTAQREIDTDFNVDGLIPNAELAIPGNGDPFRRTSHKVSLCEPNKEGFPLSGLPGVYVIDFIGGGKSSRALIRIGRLHPIVTTGTAGEVIRVVDESNKPVLDATAWIGGQEYASEKDGRILVPFSTAPGRKSIVLSRGGFACLETFDHAAENYAISAGIHIDRESLISQQIAPVLIRPQLALNGVPVSIQLLEDVRLQVTSIDLDGVPTAMEIPNFKLFEDRETIHDIRVPSRLASITVTILAKVKSLSTGKMIDLGTSRSFSVNGIDKTERIEDIHLAKLGPDTKLELLGRTGEAKSDKAVSLTFKHREFKEPVHVSLKTDAAGGINLGLLENITTVTATIPDGTTRTWNLLHDRHSYRQLLHAKAGDTVAVPYMGHAAAPNRDELALFEMVGATIRSDKFEAMKIRNGLIEIAGLSPGDYDLWLKLSGERIRIRIAAGVIENNTLLGRVRQLELPGLPPLQIESIDLGGDTVKVKLKDASKFARVHIFATRYQPEFNAFQDLAVPMAELRAGAATQAESIYLTGRNIGDEYRYVLERRTQKKYPGNMLERPALLLNPWAVRITETGEQVAQGGDKFGATGGGVHAPKAPPPPPQLEHRYANPYYRDPVGIDPVSADLDFLFDGTAIAVNQIADKDGVVTLPKKNFGPHAQFHVIAVDPLNTAYRTVTMDEQPAAFADLRLKNGLDPAKHFTQQKLTTILEANKPFEIADVAASRFETYDSLAKVYALYSTLSHDPKLAEFAFILRWPTLKPEEKRKYYSDFACHELSFFLSKKDPEFFNTVVKPYLANKKDKTFLDHWLLGSDLGRFLQPWEYSRLNVPERVLLAQRINNEPGKTARHLNDLIRLIPANTDRETFLFDVAVNARALANTAGDPMAEGKPGEKRERLKQDQERLQDMPQSKTTESAPTAGLPGMAMPSGGFAGGGGGKDGRGAAKEGKDQDKAEEPLAKADEEARRSYDYRKPIPPDDFYENDRKKQIARAFYRKVDPTTEWAENNYYKLLITQQLADLVPVNTFWGDYSKYDGQGGFLSKHLPFASRNFTEMMLALAVLDLPFEPGKHVAKFNDGKMTMTPASRIIAFHEEVRPAEGVGGQVPLLVSQNFYRQGDRFLDENGEKVDKFVTGEFVIFTVYGCQLVVTNPTSSRQKLQVLLQLPNGAIPVGNGKYTKSVNLDLQPYHTQTIDYFFYFPQPGKFSHFPVQVAKNEQFVIAAAATTFDVLAKPSKLDTGSWEYVSQNGTSEEVLAFLNRENVRAINLDKIAFRMKDRAFFETVTKLLAERHLYQNTLWSYGLLHADNATAQEFLKHQDGFIASTGPIKSTLLTIDPVDRHSYEHLEYKPLVNARAHALGNRRQIVNERFAEQYHRLLKTLSYQPTLDDTDLLATVYYLLLQDRIEEANEAFGRVKRDTVATKMQYDYCACYLEMFKDDPRKARSIATPYATHPVDRWRNTFAAVIATLDEIEGKGGKVVDAENRDQQQGQLAATEPAFEFTVDTKAMNLMWQNLDAVTVNYFPMDVELLFSSNPFVTQGSNQFASIRPNASKVVPLPKDQKTLSIPIPPEFAQKNVLIEVTAAGKSRAVPYYATAMTVGFTENYGQLKVTDTAAGKTLGKVYVKVYAKLANGQVKFHKDGYTDLRGRFDYVSVNTPERTAIERFSVLVLSEDKGAMIRETAPPAK